ncbi:MAG: hypothetical protein ACPGVD_07430 [Flavobacteriales bacterium]
MNWKKFHIVFASVLISLGGFSQTKSEEKNEIIEQRIEYIGGENEEVDYTTLLDNLYYYYDNPINLNNLNEIDVLLEMGLVSDIQLLSLKNHINSNNKLMTIYELQAVPGFDMSTIRLVLPFVKVSQDLFTPNISIKEILKSGKNEIYLRNIRDIEQKVGYSPKVEKDDNRYLGSPDKLFLRYRFKYINKISLGFTAEKDQGEEFFRGSQKGFDFYSAHFFIKDFGRVKALAIGDYHFQVGQGLTLWSGLAFGKSVDISTVKRNAVGIRHYASADENNFLRGGAATFGLTKNINLSAFYSRKRIDANITDTIDDVTNEIAFSSFQNSGFHRTEAELNDKDALLETHFGGRLEYYNQSLKIGATGFASRYDGDFQRKLSVYNQFEFADNKNFVAGLDYNYVFKNYNFFGEVSRSQNGGIAYVNGVLVSLDSRFSFTILHRNYGKDYQNLLSNGFAESSNSWNEKGIYTGFNATLTSQLFLTGSIDFFKFPWMRFQAFQPNSGGYDYTAQLLYKKSRNFSAYFRIRHQDRGINNSQIESNIYQLSTESRTNYRFQLSYKITDYLSLRNRVEVVNYQKGEADKEKGFLVYQDVVFKPKSKPYSFSARYALFDVESFNSRIYAYENDVLYYFYIPAYYRTGSRFYLTARYKYRKKFDFWVRYGIWNYRNEETILSGLEEINGNIRSDVKVVARYMF